MRLTLLGITGITGSFFLALEGQLTDRSQNLNSSVGGACELIYMLGWMCSIYGLKIIHSESKRWIRNVLTTQLIFLSLANIWNTWNIFEPNSSSTLYFILDFFWPISNLYMIVVGIAIIQAKLLQGWKRYIPFIAGCWFPVGVATWAIIGKEYAWIIFDLYSILAWAFMGWAVYSMDKKQDQVRMAF